jgi:hypothetical protein
MGIMNNIIIKSDYEDAIGCFDDKVDVSWFDNSLNNCLRNNLNYFEL